MIPPPGRLPELLRSACSERPDRASVNELVALAARIAGAYLRSRHVALEGSGGVQSIDDMALDLVGDLFCRDARGRFTALREAFEDVPEDPDVAFSRFRRLVFGRVSEGIFDHHRASDPEFARIVRNLKAAAQRAGFRVEVVHGARWLVFGDDTTPRPLVAPEVLEAMLTGHVREGMAIDAVLAAMAGALAASGGYRNAVPVVLAARVIRSAWSRLQRQALVDSLRVEPDTGSGDGMAPLRLLALSRVRAELGSTYVRTGKLSPELFEAYLSVVDRHLAAEVDDSGAVEASLYERFRLLVPGLERGEYEARHRARLEYVWRCARSALARNVRVELGFSASRSDCKE